MSNFGELQTYVRTRLIDAPTAVVTEVPLLINRAVKAIQQQHDFSVMKKQLTQIVTAAGTHNLVLRPDNWKKWRSRPYLVTDTGATKELETAEDPTTFLGQWGPLTDVTDENEPMYLTEGLPDDQGVRYLEVWPLPDGLAGWSDGEYRITIPYYGYLAAMDDGGDTNWFTVNAEDYIINRAAAQGFAVDWDDGGEAKWTAKSVSEMARIVQLDKRERLAGLHTMSFWDGPHGPRGRG